MATGHSASGQAARSDLWRWVRRIALTALALLMAAGFAVFAFLYWQGRQTPDTSGDYVALGSSFAAGIGLGPTAPGAPVQCMRTGGGYPSLVAAQARLRLADMSCSGSTASHIIDGGQLMLGPQLAAVGPRTRLVTITTGGNDVGYVGDLMAASGAMGRVGGWFWGKPVPVADRPYANVASNISNIVRRIRAVAPQARIMLIGYPPILPSQGNCPASGVDDAQATTSRAVADRLTAVTRQVASDNGIEFIDMQRIGAGHDLCSADRWVNGARPASGTAFHPNANGARAVAGQVLALLNR